MITHLHGLAKKVPYRQGLVSFPGEDASLDNEVKSAGIKALDFPARRVLVSLSRSPRGIGRSEAERGLTVPPMHWPS